MDVLLKHAGLASASGEITEDSSLHGYTNLWPRRIKLPLMVVNPIMTKKKICLATSRSVFSRKLFLSQRQLFHGEAVIASETGLAGVTVSGQPCCRSLSLWGRLLSPVSPSATHPAYQQGALQHRTQTGFSHQTATTQV